MKLQVGVNDIATTHPHLVPDWIDETVSSNQLTANSHRKVLWQCSLGHQWVAVAYSRVANGRNCPYCANQKILIGFNDLATTHPHLIAEWNDSFTSPYDVNSGSGRLVAWKCTEGHEWNGRIDHRAHRNVGCAFCDGQRKWTEEEDRYVLANSAGLLSRKQIAQNLNRTLQSVENRCRSLGVTGNYIVGGKWDEFGNHITKPKAKVGIGWKSTRVDILERDEYFCQYPNCKVFSPSGSNLQVHHIQPRKFGINDEDYNLITLCKEHHGGQVAHYWSEWTPELLPYYQKVIYFNRELVSN